jgi:hypothetical protein
MGAATGGVVVCDVGACDCGACAGADAQPPKIASHATTDRLDMNELLGMQQVVDSRGETRRPVSSAASVRA